MVSPFMPDGFFSDQVFSHRVFSQDPMIAIKVGTSGYSYPWNEGKPSPFKWYLAQGFNTVEINASFYRFPAPSWVKVWLESPPAFDFVFKVHRAITHYAKLRGKGPGFLEAFPPASEGAGGSDRVLALSNAV